MSARVGVRAGWLALASALLSGCADEPDCDVHELPCDVREPSCQRAVFALTACVRGQRGARVPQARIISRQQFADETRAELAGMMSSREVQLLEAALKLVQLLPQDGSLAGAFAESDIEGVAAYYDSNTRAITIIEDAAADHYGGTFTLSHEYVHALQDQREGLARLEDMTSSSDASLALDALVEGEATVLSDVVLTRAAESPYRSEDVLPFLDQLLNELLADVAASDAPLTEAFLVLPYPVGGRPVALTFLERGIAGVANFYRQRPETFTGWVEFERPRALPGALRCARPEPPAGYEAAGVDRLGGAALLALYTRLGFDGAQAFEAARAWSNDAFALFAPAAESSAVALAWRIRLSDPNALTALESTLRGAAFGLELARDGEELVIAGATDPSVLSGWTARNDCSFSKSRGDTPPTQKLVPDLPRRLRSPHR